MKEDAYAAMTKCTTTLFVVHSRLFHCASAVPCLSAVAGCVRVLDRLTIPWSRWTRKQRMAAVAMMRATGPTA